MNRHTILLSPILCALIFTIAATAEQTGTAPHPSPKDTDFLQQMTQEDRSEVDLAKLALQKSADPQVRQYAQGILSSDAAVEKNAQKLAPAATPTANPEVTAEYQKLANVSGREFDQEYMRYEAGRQQEDMGLLRNEISTTDDANLLDFGIKAEVPTQDAARQAQQIASKLGGRLSAKNGPGTR